MGELAALVTAVLWAFTSIFFSRAGQEVGSLVVNRIRLIFAAVLLTITHIILTGQVLPTGASAQSWLWLGLSGIVGLVFGDACLLQAYVMVGARIGTLIMAIVPVISALFAWLLLGESLSAFEVAGILITVLGISIVVAERGANGIHLKDRRQYALGILCGLGGALGQAGGLILAKMGLTDDLPTISGVVIRMITAMLVMWAITLVARQGATTLRTAREHPKAVRFIAAGAMVGPFLGVWLSLVSIKAAYVGIASTLMALTPILVLPLLRWFYHETISKRALAGTVVSILGVAMIFIVG